MIAARRWKSEAECRSALYSAAWSEAINDPAWPTEWKLLLVSPYETEADNVAPSSLDEPSCVADHAVAGWILLEALDRYAKSVSVLNAEEERTSAAVREVGGLASVPLEDALPSQLAKVRDIVLMRTKFAEFRHGAPVRTVGRRMAVFRQRIANRMIGGHRLLSANERQPSQRDLALALIGAHVFELAPGWKHMTVAELIRWEAKAMAEYLPETKKRRRARRDARKLDT